MSFKFAAGAGLVALFVGGVSTVSLAQEPPQPAAQTSAEDRAAYKARRAERERRRNSTIPGLAGSAPAAPTITRPPGSPSPTLIAQPKFGRAPLRIDPPDWAFREGKSGQATTQCTVTDGGTLIACQPVSASDPRAGSWAVNYARYYRLAPSSPEKAWLPGDMAEYTLRWAIE